MDHDELPYLLDHAEAAVTAVADMDTSIIELTVHGRWNRELKSAVVTTLQKTLSEQPSGVIVDLHDLGDPLGESAMLWPAARKWGAELRPAVPFAICLPTQAPLAVVLRRCGAQYHQPMYATLPEARAALRSRRPLTDRLCLGLPAGPAAAAAARDLVTDGCTTWNLTSVLPAAQQVITELVVNAVQHGGSDIKISVARQRTGVHLAVADGNPRIPQMRHFPGGLHVVHNLASAWGALPTRSGKVVWANVRSRGNQRQGNGA
ncbi:ATP-binding protein [Actinoplanes sp. NPDC051859]|uniref:ATP-binding protein n=1 Tax=Actinoplanes sp. NPDC051859 TaxID=3363909 RepID=UPI00379801C0